MKKNLELSKVSVDNIKQLQDFIASVYLLPAKYLNVP
jgi:hypothetical protein